MLRNYILLIVLAVSFGFGCQAEISNIDDSENYKHHLGQKFIIKENFFIVRFHDEIISEKMIEFPSDVSGDDRDPTIRQFLEFPNDTYTCKGCESKVISLKEGGEEFKVLHIFDFYDNPSYSFIYLLMESMNTGQTFAIHEAVYSIGIRDGYIIKI